MPRARKATLPVRKRKDRNKRRRNVSNVTAEDSDKIVDTDSGQQKEVRVLDANIKANLAFLAAAIAGIMFISIVLTSFFRGQRKQHEMEEMDAYLNMLFRNKQPGASRNMLNPAKTITLVATIAVMVGVFSYQKRWSDRMEQTEYNKRLQLQWLSASTAVFALIIFYFSKINSTDIEGKNGGWRKKDASHYAPFLIGLALAYNTRNLFRQNCSQPTPVQSRPPPIPHVPQNLRFEQFRRLQSEASGYMSFDNRTGCHSHTHSQASHYSPVPPMEPLHPRRFVMSSNQDVWSNSHQDPSAVSEDFLYRDRFQRKFAKRKRRKRRHRRRRRHHDGRGDQRGFDKYSHGELNRHGELDRHGELHTVERPQQQRYQPMRKHKSQIYECEISGGRYHD